MFGRRFAATCTRQGLCPIFGAVAPAGDLPGRSDANGSAAGGAEHGRARLRAELLASVGIAGDGGSRTRAGAALPLRRPVAQGTAQRALAAPAADLPRRRTVDLGGMAAGDALAPDPLPGGPRRRGGVGGDRGGVARRRLAGRAAAAAPRRPPGRSRTRRRDAARRGRTRGQRSSLRSRVSPGPPTSTTSWTASDGLAGGMAVCGFGALRGRGGARRRRWLRGARALASRRRLPFLVVNCAAGAHLHGRRRLGAARLPRGALGLRRLGRRDLAGVVPAARLLAVRRRRDASRSRARVARRARLAGAPRALLPAPARSWAPGIGGRCWSTAC